MKKVLLILGLSVGVLYSQVPVDTLLVDTIVYVVPIDSVCDTIVVDTISADMNLCNIESYLYFIEVKNVDIVMRQCIWETGWLKSKACLYRYNLFGFNNGKSGFKSWKESCDKYKIWQDKHYIDDSKDYYKWLNCMWRGDDGSCVRYASSTTYTSKLKSLNFISCIKN